MRFTLIIRTLLRSPIKTILTFTLIAAAGFAVFSRVLDSTATNREMNRAVSYYRGVSAIDTGVENMWWHFGSYLPNSAIGNDPRNPSKLPPPTLTAEHVAAFSALPGVSSTDIRYMTSGLIDGLEMIDLQEPYKTQYSYTDRFVIEGTISGIKLENIWGVDKNHIYLTDIKQLAGALPLQAGETAVIASPTDDFAAWGIMERSVYSLRDNPYGQDFIDYLEIGERCVIIGRWDSRGLHGISQDGFEHMEAFIGDYDTSDYVHAFYSLDGKPNNYLETEEFANLKKIVEITNHDLKAFNMVYTSDLLSIPYFNEGNMIIKEGRAITAADENACVINNVLAQTNGLGVGDKLTVELYNKLLMQHGGMGATAVIPERFGEPAGIAELEIVGIYADLAPTYERHGDIWWWYSPNTIFVPHSLLPIEIPADHPIYPGEFSLIADDPFMLQTFLDEARALAKEMGLKLRFSDKGWRRASEHIDAGQKMSLLTMLMLLCASAIAIFLTFYLYIAREKKSFAIMRALGTPLKKARNTLALPIVILSAAAVLCGGFAGLIYAQNAIIEMANQLALSVTIEYIPDTALPVNSIFLCVAGEFLFIFSVLALFIKKLEKTPVLELLQGETAETKAKKGEPTTNKEEVTPLAFALPEMPQTGVHSAFRHVFRYILRHIRRAKLKSIAAVILALLLTGSCGLLSIIKLSYIELFEQTEIRGYLTNFTSRAVTEAEKSELIENFYYSGGFPVIYNGIFNHNDGYYFAVTNDFDKYVTALSPFEYDVWYGDGYGAGFFSKGDSESRLIVIGNGLAATLGVAPGDGVHLFGRERAQVFADVFGTEGYESKIEKNQIRFTVAGIVTSQDRRIAEGIFAPNSNTAQKINSAENPFAVEFAEFTAADKENLHQLIEYLDELSRSEHLYQGEVLYHLDISEIDNIKRIRELLTMLFPLALAAAVIIGLTAPLLIIAQSSKEAAILRILGTTKLRARLMLTIEQISLCVFGVIFSSAGLFIYNSELFIKDINSLLLCVISYLLPCMSAAIIAADYVTKKIKVL
ncbi:MAG: hypothetical protein FWG90_02225 [Oscillospiraceae bacterium]|nr:hypothetical protein [Oscillospiraceae bacterium]